MRVLIVEDNPDLRRQLCRLLENHNVNCVAVQNENEAICQVSFELDAIVADIDLREAGGDKRGGILLAELLVEKGLKVPIILISYDAHRSLPAPGSSEYAETLSRLGVRAVLDRNNERFHEELITRLFPAAQSGEGNAR